jgi:phosphonate transport system substrate-binding protein
MKKFFAVVLVVALALSALPGAQSALAQGDLGSPENPIEVYFVPSGEAATIVEGGQVLSDALNAATGLTFEVFVPTSYAATIEAMCAAPDRTLGFIPAAGYVIANNRCGVEVAAAAVRNVGPCTGGIRCRRDSDIYTLATWTARPGAMATPADFGYIVPSVEFSEAGLPGRGSADRRPQPDSPRRLQRRSGLRHRVLQPAR